MTLEETGIIMDILTAAYPRMYAGLDAPNPMNTLNLWAEIFRDDDVALVAAAVKALIVSDEKGFPPHIGAVKAKMRLLTRDMDMTEMDAWNLVAKALRNSAYGAAEEFQKLPPDIRRIVGGPSQLRDWAMMDSETVHSVVASNFQRSYKIIAARKRELEQLPSDVREVLSGIAGHTAMKAGGNDARLGPSRNEKAASQ